MGKKTTKSTKEAAPAKRAAKPSTKNQRAAEAAVITPPAKSATPKNGTDAAPKSATTKRASKPATKSAPAFTDADVLLRAYFIAENAWPPDCPAIRSGLAGGGTPAHGRDRGAEKAEVGQESLIRGNYGAGRKVPLTNSPA